MDTNKLIEVKDKFNNEWKESIAEFRKFYENTDYYNEHIAGNLSDDELDNDFQMLIENMIEGGCYGDYFDDFGFCDGESQREYENYESKFNLYDQLNVLLDSLIPVENEADTEARNFFAKVIILDTVIAKCKKAKEESERIIEREKSVINVAESILKTLDEIKKGD